MNLPSLLGGLDAALAIGNVATPARHVIEAIQVAPPADRPSLYAWLQSAIEKRLDGLGAPGRQRLLSLLPPEPADPEEREYWACVRRMLNQPVPLPGPGRVNIVFAVSGGAVVRGVTHELVMHAEAYGGGIRLDHHDERIGALYAGFWAGCTAAQDYLVGRLAGDAAGLGERLVYNRQLTGTLPTLPTRPHGASLGLGSAIAALSAMLKIPMPATVAFTGRIDRTGRLYSVDGVTDKAAAAGDVGIEKLLIPADSAPSIGTAADGAAVISCSTLADAVAEMFEPQALHRALESLRRERPSAYSSRDWRVGLDSRERALFTMVGSSDPIGTYKDRSGRSLPHSEEGPILAACRELQPARVFLFFTIAEGRNDMSVNAEAAGGFIREQLPTCDVRSCALPPSLTDPTDLEAVWEELARQVDGLQAGEDVLGRYACYVNMTSGTGQMQFVWALLVMAGLLPATLVQVRESRYVQAGESRIRRVVLPRFANPPRT